MAEIQSEPIVDHRFTRLKELLAEVSDLRSAANVLSWDQETYMPSGAVDARARQISTVQQLAHERFTSDEIGSLLDDLEPIASELEPLSTEASLVRVIRRDYEKAVKLPLTLVAAMAEAVSRGKEAWKHARSANRFEDFAPHLTTLIDLNIQKAEAYGYDDRIYDALLDEYEPGMKTRQVEKVFEDLRRELVPLVEAIAQSEETDDSILHKHFDRQAQWDFGLEVIQAFGYDLHRGRQDVSAHPFTTTFSITDVRITTRISEDFLNPGLFGTMHEAGHALYEQGVDLQLDRTLLDDGTSLGIHESQSRLWENLVGRSLPFWRHYYPRLHSVFAEQLEGVSLDTFYRAINRVHPGPIRVEADELTYNLHIMLRFELENALLENRIEVADLPEIWNDRVDEYLGIRPSNDTEGVLQDIHWSLGAFGYFPTYALGNLMSSQFYAQADRELADLEGQIAEGRFEELLDWLREKIHRHGRKRDANDLLQDVTGRTLDASSWLSYIRQKYGRLYEGLPV